MAIGEKKKRAPGAGRKPGVPNKLTANIKAMVMEALDRVGGVDYLVSVAKTNDRAFLGLLGRLLPLQVEGSLTHNHVARMPEVAKDTDEWAKLYSPTHNQPATRQ